MVLDLCWKRLRAWRKKSVVLGNKITPIEKQSFKIRILVVYCFCALQLYYLGNASKTINIVLDDSLLDIVLVFNGRRNKSIIRLILALFNWNYRHSLTKIFSVVIFYAQDLPFLFCSNFSH